MGTPTVTPTPDFDPAREKVCKRCHKVFSLFSERCPHCGKDSAYGTQAGGLLFTLGMLMLAPIAMVILIYFIW